MSYTASRLNRYTSIPLLFILITGGRGFRNPVADALANLQQEPNISIVNQTDEPICHVYASPGGLDFWEDKAQWEEWLVDEPAIEPSETRVFNPPGDFYDVFVADCGDAPLHGWFGREPSERPQLILKQNELCWALNWEGYVNYNAWEMQRALVYFTKGLRCYRNTGDREGEAKSLNNIGELYNQLGEYFSALRYLEQALVIRREVADRAGEAHTHNNLATVYYSQGRYEKALTSYELALSINRDLQDRESEGANLSNIGAAWAAMGRHELALENLEQSLAIALEMEQGAELGRRLSNISVTYSILGRVEEALRTVQQALEIARELGNPEDEATALHNLSGVYIIEGRYTEAQAFEGQVLSISQGIGNRPGVASALNSMGTLLNVQGRYEEALEQYDQSLSIFRDLGLRRGEGLVLHNTGTVLSAQGRYAEAIDHFEQAAALRRQIGDRTGQAATLHQIAVIYSKLGQLDEALSMYQQSLEIHLEVGNQLGAALALAGLGLTNSDLGHETEALQQLQEALDIQLQLGDRLDAGTTLNGLALIYQSQGNLERASELLKQALDIQKEIGARPDEADTLMNMGGVFLNQDDDVRALELSEQALAIYREIGAQDGVAAALYNVGFIYLVKGDHHKALDYHEQAMNAFEGIRAMAGTDEARADFIASYIGLFDQAVDLYLKTEQFDSAFYTSERARARTFLDSLATGYVQLSNEDMEELIEQERSAYQARQVLQDSLARVGGHIPVDDGLIAKLEADLVEAETAYGAVVDQILARDDALASLIPGRGLGYVLDASEVQALLPDDSTLVAYFLYSDHEKQDHAVAFVLTQDEFEAVPLPVGEEQLRGVLADFRSFPSTSEVQPESLRQLYAWLIEPIAEHVNSSRLIIIPHGVLHYLSFAALTDGEQYLGERFVITTLPSASILPLLGESQAERDTPLVLGNPLGDAGLGNLPAAEAEAQAVAALYGDTAHVGVEATETLVRTQAGRYGALHVAAHATLNQAAPLQSWLSLAPDGANDGRLHVDEVYSLDLTATDLVVLSACETSIEYDDDLEVSPGDDIVALNRAFHFAGARNVIASLWRVDDASTAVLMTRFYGYLDEGWGEAEALRQAQNDLRTEHPEYGHPFYWAAFVLSGDGGELTRPIPIAGAATETVAPMLTLQPEPSASEPTSEASPRPALCAGAALPLALVFLVVQRRRR